MLKDNQIKKHSIMNYWRGAELKGNLSRRLLEVLFIGTLKIIEKRILFDIIILHDNLQYGIEETDETLLSLHPQDDE
jgi:hypothetical protein